MPAAGKNESCIDFHYIYDLYDFRTNHSIENDEAALIKVTITLR